MTCLNARFMRRVLPDIDAIDIRQAEIAHAAGEMLADVVRDPESHRRQTWIQPILEVRGSVTHPRL